MEFFYYGDVKYNNKVGEVGEFKKRLNLFFIRYIFEKKIKK